MNSKYQGWWPGSSNYGTGSGENFTNWSSYTDPSFQAWSQQQQQQGGTGGSSYNTSMYPNYNTGGGGGNTSSNYGSNQSYNNQSGYSMSHVQQTPGNYNTSQNSGSNTGSYGSQQSSGTQGGASNASYTTSQSNTGTYNTQGNSSNTQSYSTLQSNMGNPPSYSTGQSSSANSTNYTTQSSNQTGNYGGSQQSANNSGNQQSANNYTTSQTPNTGNMANYSTQAVNTSNTANYSTQAGTTGNTNNYSTQQGPDSTGMQPSNNSGNQSNYNMPQQQNTGNMPPSNTGNMPPSNSGNMPPLQNAGNMPPSNSGNMPPLQNAGNMPPSNTGNMPPLQNAGNMPPSNVGNMPPHNMGYPNYDYSGYGGGSYDYGWNSGGWNGGPGGWNDGPGGWNDGRGGWNDGSRGWNDGSRGWNDGPSGWNSGPGRWNDGPRKWNDGPGRWNDGPPGGWNESPGYGSSGPGRFDDEPRRFGDRPQRFGEGRGRFGDRRGGRFGDRQGGRYGDGPGRFDDGPEGYDDGPRGGRFPPPRGWERDERDDFDDPRDRKEKSRPRYKYKEKLQRLRIFIEFLKNGDSTKNGRPRIHSAISKCNVECALEMHFDEQSDSFLDSRNNPWRTHVVKIDDIFISRADHRILRSARREAYNRAIHAFTTMSPEEILKLKDIGPDPDAGAPRTGAFGFGGARFAQDSEIPFNCPPASSSEDEEEEAEEEFEKLKQLRQHVIGLDPTKNSDRKMSDLVEEAMASLEISYDYQEEERKRACGGRWVVGTLKVGEVIISTGAGPTEEKAKILALEKAFVFLRNKWSIVKKGMEVLEKDLLPEFEVMSYKHFDLPNKDTLQRLANMMHRLKSMPKKIPLVAGIDHAATRCYLFLMRIFKKKPDEEFKSLQICEIYIDNIFIGEGTGGNQTDAEHKAYKETYQALCTSNVNIIVNVNKRLNRADVLDIIEIVEITKTIQVKTSLFSYAKRSQQKIRAAADDNESDYVARNLDEIVIMENAKHSLDRFHMACETLQASAMMNGLILEGRILQVGLSNTFRCELFVEGEKVVACDGEGRMRASANAAANLLFNLYHTRPVIQMVTWKDPGTWIKYETLAQKAEAMRIDKGDKYLPEMSMLHADEAQVTQVVATETGEGGEEEKADEGEQPEEDSDGEDRLDSNDAAFQTPNTNNENAFQPTNESVEEPQEENNDDVDEATESTNNDAVYVTPGENKEAWQENTDEQVDDGNGETTEAGQGEENYGETEEQPQETAEGENAEGQITEGQEEGEGQANEEGGEVEENEGQEGEGQEGESEVVSENKVFTPWQVLQKWVFLVIEDMLKDFAQRETLEDLNFGGGYHMCDLEHIRKVCQKLHLSALIKTKFRKNYCVVHQRHMPAKIYELLQAREDGACGKYSLLSPDDLPTVDDIEQMSQLPPLKQQKFAPKEDYTPEADTRKRRRGFVRTERQKFRQKPWHKKRRYNQRDNYDED